VKKEKGLACITVFLWFIIISSNILGYLILVALRDETAKCCPMVPLPVYLAVSVIFAAFLTRPWCLWHTKYQTEIVNELFMQLRRPDTFTLTPSLATRNATFFQMKTNSGSLPGILSSILFWQN